MYARLMYRDRDFEPDIALGNESDLRQDLELDRILDVMGGESAFVRKVCCAALLSPLGSTAEVRFRQEVLGDCLAHPETFRELYELVFGSVRDERQHRVFAWRDSPESVLSGSVTVLSFYAGELRKLRDYVATHRPEFRSEGMLRLCDEFAAELADAYLAEIDEMLDTLRFRHGTLMSARLGPGSKGRDYVLLVQPEVRWWERLKEELHTSEPSFEVHPRDDAGIQQLSNLKARGLNSTANVVAQAADHLRAFFTALLAELGFYIGCLNLHDALDELGVETCIPVPTEPAQAAGPSQTVEPAPAAGPSQTVNPASTPAPSQTVDPAPTLLRADELCETSLALKLGRAIGGNSFDAAGNLLVIVTGANRGGKSTFLRSVGQAQLMMQAGMFVAARAFSSDLRDRIFTHFKRSEDDTMTSGKLDEELVRMGEIAQQLTPTSQLLFNESFASTNEREGSEIARQVTEALVESGVKVIFVTHLFEFATSALEHWRDQTLFLRAPRADGARDYRLTGGAPEPTSYGQDTYRDVFGPAAASG